jgi:hypothetical protein
MIRRGGEEGGGEGEGNEKEEEEIGEVVGLPVNVLYYWRRNCHSAKMFPGLLA